MAAIRNSLQREVFQPSDERLVAVVHVSKPGKKKNKQPCFLCIAINSEKPVSIFIYQVKKTDKYGLKKKNQWNLRQLKSVDGKSESKEVTEFDTCFDKVYKWTASNGHEKLNFIAMLWKMCQKYLPKQTPSFTNIPPQIMQESLELEVIGQSDVAASIDDNSSDYQLLSEKEELDLEKLMSECQFAISNAEAFSEQLSKDLSLLDGANIHSILGSEKQVSEVIHLIDLALDEANQLETLLTSYEDALHNVRLSIKVIEEKTSMLKIVNLNSRKLLDTLNSLVNQMDLSRKHELALTEADLSNADKLPETIEAAQMLEKAMNAEIHPALLRMSAVQEQMKRFERWKTKFAQNISRHLNNLFIQMGNEIPSNLTVATGELSMPKHSAIHNRLNKYSYLMKWLKSMDLSSYESLRKVYISSIGKVYEADIRMYFEEASQRAASVKDQRGTLKSRSGSNQDLQKIKSKSQAAGSNTPLGHKSSYSLLAVDRDQWEPEVTIAEQKMLRVLFENVLINLEPVCLEEQRFSISFFKLDAAKPGLVSSESQFFRDIESPNNLNKKLEKQISADVRKVMGSLFLNLESELLSFIGVYERMDSFYPMYVMVSLSRHVMSMQDTGSFLSVTFANALVHVKRSFDKFMQSQLKSIEECKANKKNACGILPFVTNFQKFAEIVEEIFKNSDRRNDLDKWYVQLVKSMFEAIHRISIEHPKTPQEVVQMENFHHLHALLSRLKVNVLEQLKKDSKTKYNESLQAYVIRYFGRPLEKLNLFFEGVQNKVSQGVKEEEIGYQLAYSKQELRKLIKEYQPKDVKRGLENLYKKIERHLSEEENLLQVVWHAMQEEFINQYKCLENLIQRCYPGSMINLEFTIDDLLRFFSEIARLH